MREPRLLAAALIAATSVAGCSSAADDSADSAADELRGGACAGIGAAAVSKDAREFMATHSLIRPGEEQSQPGVESKWKAIKTVTSQGACLLVMNVVTKAFGVESESETYEVIAAQKTGTGKIALRTFEETRQVPSSIRVGVGMGEAARDPDGNVLWDVLYYTELSGADAIAVSKTMAAGLERKVMGLAADISARNVRTEGSALRGAPDGKLSWDPTPNRTWKLKNATFSLRRGQSAEQLDVQPWQIDGDFAGYYSGSGGKIAPWGSAFLRRVYVDSAWNDRIPYREPPANP